MSGIDEFLQVVKTFLGRRAYSQKLTIAANTTFTLDLTTLVTTLTDFDILATTTDVKVLDTQSGSPTNGLYINSELFVSVGINESTNSLVIRNHTDSTVDCYVRVTMYRR
jgi:hypothetical protein